jgi:hypothetical protein
MGSGLIYLAIVIVWAAILIPMFLRSRDAALEDRSVERFDHAMSILSQQEEAELPHSPEYRAAEPRKDEASHRETMPAQAGRRRVTTDQAAERQTGPAKRVRRRPSLARRRARTLITLLALTLVAALLAFTPFVPLWAPLPFAVLLVSFVVHLRNQAVRQQRGRQSPTAERLEVSAPEPASAEEQSAQPQESARPPARTEFVPGPSRAVVVETKGTGAAANADSSSHPDGLLADDEAWRPNPLPLPTYVTAPKAVRPIRVIDLTTPGAWTSGRLLDDDSVMEDVLAEQVASDELDALLEHEARGSRSKDDASRRAVGD